jgi:hypothetical protein
MSDTRKRKAVVPVEFRGLSLFAFASMVLRTPCGLEVPLSILVLVRRTKGGSQPGTVDSGVLFEPFTKRPERPRATRRFFSLAVIC